MKKLIITALMLLIMAFGALAFEGNSCSAKKDPCGNADYYTDYVPMPHGFYANRAAESMQFEIIRNEARRHHRSVFSQGYITGFDDGLERGYNIGFKKGKLYTYHSFRNYQCGLRIRPYYYGCWHSFVFY
ncbi:hypothetical protein D6745_01145 [Candidatus Woesearchaeota archaeon]|nr:MAG: hypothetical protein D6745_01145 [Candidatus Woesearchaeota archaeon]